MGKKNEVYEEKIHNEILVDCKDYYEQNMSWYNYVDDELQFPFTAEIELHRRNGQKELKRIEVVKLSEDSSNFEALFDLKVDIDMHEYLIEIPLMNLKNVQESERTIEMIEIWKYWRTNWTLVQH